MESRICPKCGVSEMWDNRAKKASGQFNPKSPDFSCKNKKCGGAIWPPKKKKEVERVYDEQGFSYAGEKENEKDDPSLTPDTVKKIEQLKSEFSDKMTKNDWEVKDIGITHQHSQNMALIYVEMCIEAGLYAEDKLHELGRDLLFMEVQKYADMFTADVRDTKKRYGGV